MYIQIWMRTSSNASICLGYDEYIGRLGIGRLYSGVLKQGQQYIRCNQSGLNAKESLSKLFSIQRII